MRIKSRKIGKIATDALVYACGFVLAYWIRFDGPPPTASPRLLDPDFFQQMQVLLGFVVAARILLNVAFGAYRQIWAYFGLNDLIILFSATAIPSVILALARLFLRTVEYNFWRVPFGVIAVDLMLAVGGSVGVRLLRRVWVERSETRVGLRARESSNKLRVLLAGAGMAGIMVAKEARKGKNQQWTLVGFVDDNPHKRKTKIHGIPVIGRTSDIPALVKARRVDRVIITIANAHSRDIRRIVDICESVPVPVKIIPGMLEILDEKVTISRLRDVAIDDLLGREVVSFKESSASISQNFHGKRILVTGAGGSIGGEMCRQIGIFAPSKLFLVDKDENSLYEIQNDLRRLFPHLAVSHLISDIRNREHLLSLIGPQHPHVIFHTAAHKHVPLMEENVIEAVTNNIGGTLNLLDLADEWDCERFVMLSTDKAVNPTSVMGATKRIAELMIQSKAGQKTLFSCVRFGNVLGSRGSVVPLLKRQIALGGPLTITDQNVTRFFMTIPEATQLVIQAASLGARGEIYVLDMGNPIRIIDLARDLIRLSGLQEDTLEIQYTGLRAGEKMHEELYHSFEKATPTAFPKIMALEPVTINYKKFWERLDLLLKSCSSADETVVRQGLFSLLSSCNRDLEESTPLRVVEKPAGSRHTL